MRGAFRVSGVTPDFADRTDFATIAASLFRPSRLLSEWKRMFWRINFESTNMLDILPDCNSPLHTLLSCDLDGTCGNDAPPARIRSVSSNPEGSLTA